MSPNSHTAVTTPASAFPGSGDDATSSAVQVVAAGDSPRGTSYRWRVEGHAVRQSTGARYAITMAGTIAAKTPEGVPVPVAPVIRSVAISPAAGQVGQRFKAVVEADGAPDGVLTFQWILDGREIAGATDAAFVSDAAGSLSLRVTARSENGTALAEAAAVTVAPAPPVIRTVRIEPEGGLVGDTLLAMVDASGSPLLAFVWKLDGAEIEGATGETFVATEAGSISVQVAASNAFGTATVEAAAVPIVQPALPPGLFAEDIFAAGVFV